MLIFSFNSRDCFVCLKLKEKETDSLILLQNVSFTDSVKYKNIHGYMQIIIIIIENIIKPIQNRVGYLWQLWTSRNLEGNIEIKYIIMAINF